MATTYPLPLNRYQSHTSTLTNTITTSSTILHAGKIPKSVYSLSIFPYHNKEFINVYAVNVYIKISPYPNLC